MRTCPALGPLERRTTAWYKAFKRTIPFGTTKEVTVALELQDYERPSWDEYFMKLANEVSTRTTCLRRAVGAIIVKDRRILATGYNGVPTGLRHCNVTGCLREQLGVPSGQRHEICRGLHAEQNALLQAARYGINISGASIYITTQPCVVCAKMLTNAGISEIVYQNPYPDELAMELLKEAGMKMRVFDGQNSKNVGNAG